MTNLNTPKTLITGATGMVGTYLRKLLPEAFYTTIDLRNRVLVEALFNIHRFDYVFHLAARVGGLGANMNNQKDFFEDNIYINTNVLSVAAKYKVKRLISVLSTCVYPADAPLPLEEENIHASSPHFSNYGYAYAKRMAHIQTLTLRECGHDFFCVVPNNLVGMYDNFELNNSHVIPAIIRKIHQAKTNDLSKVELWGDGSPLRQFTYAGDLASILEYLMFNGSNTDILNVGNTVSYSIKEIAQRIQTVLCYNGKLEWNTEMPNGQQQKPSTCAEFEKTGWSKNHSYIDLIEAITIVCDWYSANYPDIRGV